MGKNKYITLKEAFCLFEDNFNYQNIDELKLQFIRNVVNHLKEATFEYVNIKDVEPIGLERWIREFKLDDLVLMKVWPICWRNTYTKSPPPREKFLIAGERIDFPADIIFERKSFESLSVWKEKSTVINWHDLIKSKIDSGEKRLSRRELEAIWRATPDESRGIKYEELLSIVDLLQGPAEPGRPRKEKT